MYPLINFGQSTVLTFIQSALKWDISKQENTCARYHGKRQLNREWTVCCHNSASQQPKLFGIDYEL